MAVLGELEHRIMRVLWASDDALSVRAVHEALQTDRDLAYTTVMTVLDRLAKKGTVSRVQEGRAWIYRPAQSQAELIAAELAAVLGQAEGNDVAVWHRLFELLEPEQRAALEQAASPAERTPG